MDKKIKALLEEKLHMMEKLLCITQNLFDNIKREDTEELLKSLNSRQQIMEDVDALDRQILGFFRNDINSFKKYVKTSGKSLQDTYYNILSVIKKIKAVDDKNQENIKALLSKIRGDIFKLKQTKTALKGYGIIGDRNTDGAFIDTRK